MVVRTDEARHDEAAGRVNLRGAGHGQVRPDGDDFLALDHYVGFGEIADIRVHRHHGTATNDVAPARLAGIVRRIIVLLILRRGRARREQIETCGGDSGGRCSLLENGRWIEYRTGMVLFY